MNPYLGLAAYWRERYAGPVRKVVLDAGLSCPNRDGTLSRAGCAFCNPRGSGSGLADQGLSLAEQWTAMAPRVLARHATKAGPPLLVAYLQAFTNTHCSPQRLSELLEETAALPGIGGLSIGTRPDCLDGDKLTRIAGLAPRLDPLILELGLQSADDQTLRRINRGHDAACLAQAARRAAALGLEVVVHVIAGLPGEGLEHLLRTMDFINALPVRGVKLHNLYVARGTAMAKLWRAGEYVPPGLEEYAHWAALALARLRPDVVVHRITGDPAPDELLAPDWAANKGAVLTAIRERMRTKGLTQGRDYSSPGQGE